MANSDPPANTTDGFGFAAQDRAAACLVALHRLLEALDPEEWRYVRVAEALAVKTADALNSWLYTRSENSDRVATLHVASFAGDERTRAGLWYEDLSQEVANERLQSGDRGLFAVASWPESQASDLRNLLLLATAARWHEGKSPASVSAQLAIQAIAYAPYRRAIDQPRRHQALVTGSATTTDKARAALIRESMEGEYAVSGRGAVPVWSEERLERVLALADEMPEPEVA